MASVTVTARAAATADVVWEVLTDSSGWADWSDFSDSVREREGLDDPDGVGSIRQAWTAGVMPAREEVVTFERDKGLYEYVILSGVPVRDYRGTVRLAEHNGTTTIDWTASFRPLLPVPLAGTALEMVFRLVLGRTVRQLAGEAERRVAVGR